MDYAIIESLKAKIDLLEEELLILRKDNALLRNENIDYKTKMTLIKNMLEGWK